MEELEEETKDKEDNDKETGEEKERKKTFVSTYVLFKSLL